MATDKLSSGMKRMLIAQHFVHETDKHQNIIYLFKSFYRFMDGWWQKMDDDVAESIIFHKAMDLDEKGEPPSANQIKEIVKMMKFLTYDQYSDVISDRLTNKMRNEINLKNGILSLDDFSVRPYKQSELAMYKLGFEYDGDCKTFEAPYFFKYLMSSMNIDEGTASEDDIQLIEFIQEFMGYCLILGNPLGRNLIMYGDGRNGKGVFMDIMNALLGRENVSSCDLKDVDDPRKVHMTKNKLVNFSEDLEKGQQLDTSILKRAAVGEMITADEKFKDPYEFQFTAKMIVACNKKPYLKNITTAIRERWYLLPFTRTFETGSPDRIDNLEQLIIDSELDMVFAWAVDGLKRLLRRGRFLPPKRCQVAMEEYLIENSSVLCWLSEGNVVKEPEVSCKGTELYEDYRLFCERTNNRADKLQDFYAELKKHGYKSDRRKRIMYFNGITHENASGMPF